MRADPAGATSRVLVDRQSFKILIQKHNCGEVCERRGARAARCALRVRVSPPSRPSVRLVRRTRPPCF
eukprot:2182892-Prymnesium_polylepis.1